MTDQPVLDAAAQDRLRRIGGGKLLAQMIDLFLKHGPERIGAIRSAAAAGDAAALERAAHTLKSSAGNLGAGALQDAAARAEEQAASGHIDAALIEHLTACHEATVHALGQVQEGLTA